MTDEEWFAEANVYTGKDLTFEHARICASYFSSARRDNLLMAVHYELRTRKMLAYMRCEIREPMLPIDNCVKDSIVHARLDAARAAYYEQMTQLLFADQFVDVL